MCLARIYGRHDRPDERHANARLIAAAPDLLAALSAIASLNLVDHLGPHDMAMHAVDIARAAIAKATGADK